MVTDAIKYVNSKINNLNTADKKLLQDIKDKGEEEETEDVEDANEGLEKSTLTPTSTETE